MIHRSPSPYLYHPQHLAFIHTSNLSPANFFILSCSSSGSGRYIDEAVHGLGNCVLGNREVVGCAISNTGTLPCGFGGWSRESSALSTHHCVRSTTYHNNCARKHAEKQGLATHCYDYVHRNGKLSCVQKKASEAVKQTYQYQLVMDMNQK
ncbi:hypothetical protein JB92DRAFT_2829325 [Gautieria morchelliformis]|nr:hypothetical protein JB92DRAFT_2829325 [Gautieria morchelliformis]